MPIVEGSMQFSRVGLGIITSKPDPVEFEVGQDTSTEDGWPARAVIIYDGGNVTMEHVGRGVYVEAAPCDGSPPKERS